MKLKNDDLELLESMSKTTIKYFAALMHVFEIKNFWEATAETEGYRYKLKITKEKI